MKKLTDHLADFADRKVIVRCNFDVPIQDNQVQDTTRIESAVPTLKALRQQNAKLILLAHYDRPEGHFDPQKSLRPVVVQLEPLIGEPVEFIEYISDINQLVIPHRHPISLIDNLRFWPGEEDNDAEFALNFSRLADSFVNESFATCHREHASMVSLPKHLPSYAGIALAQEVETITRIKQSPEKPLVVVIGGAKLETKEPLIQAFKDKAEFILVGGKIALDIKEKNLKLPANVLVADLTPDGKDITSQSAQLFAERIQAAATVVWNGTMGVFEDPQHREGTAIVARAVNSTPAFTLVGGGDTETALTLLNLESGIDFISTGGGAMMTLLSQDTLPGLKALN